MAIINDLLKKRKNNPATSFLPVNEEEMVPNPAFEETAERRPDIPVTKASDVRQEQSPVQAVKESEQSTAQPEVKYPNKPQALSDDDYEHLLKYNTPEQIATYTAPFDPTSGENYLQRLYQSSVTKPEPVDEKKLRNAQLAASVGDALGLLSQMYTYGRGAHVQKRDPKSFATSKVSEDAKEYQNRYLKLLQQYETGAFNAGMRDFLRALDDYNNGRKGIQGVLAAKQTLDEKARQADEKMRYNYDKLAADQSNKDREFDLKKANHESLDHHRKALEAQGWARVADSKSRTAAYVRKTGSGSGSGKGYEMIFAAHPDDTNIQTDQFGNRIKAFEMTEGQIDQYARQAIADKDFMERHQELTVKSKDILGNGLEKLKPNEDIAAAWLQEQYEKGFLSPEINNFQPSDIDAWSGAAIQSGPRQGNYPVVVNENSPEEELEEIEEDDEFPGVGNIANF